MASRLYKTGAKQKTAGAHNCKGMAHDEEQDQDRRRGPYCKWSDTEESSLACRDFAGLFLILLAGLACAALNSLYPTDHSLSVVRMDKINRNKI